MDSVESSTSTIRQIDYSRVSCESEDAFGKLFDQDITEDDKIYILAVIARLQRILNWQPQDEDLILKKQRGPQMIREILRQFLRWKEFAEESEAADTQRKKHLVIYSLAKLCYYYWIIDSRLVAEILRYVFECDGHFSSMFAHIANRFDRHSLWRQTINNANKRECSATYFFVYHAHNARLQFGGVRFVDIRLRHPLSVPPVFLAAIYSRPNLLLLLLRYGADAQLISQRMDPDWSLPMLLRHLIRILWNSLGDDLQNFDFCPWKSPVVSNMVLEIAECLRILLRVIPQIPIGEISFFLMKFDQGILTGSIYSHDFIHLLAESGLVPKLVNRYLEPSDLYHLCRCALRKSLNKSWNLPYGVSVLPLPTLVKNYLSILED